MHPSLQAKGITHPTVVPALADDLVAMMRAPREHLLLTMFCVAKVQCLATRLILHLLQSPLTASLVIAPTAASTANAFLAMGLAGCLQDKRIVLEHETRPALTPTVGSVNLSSREATRRTVRATILDRSVTMICIHEFHHICRPQTMAVWLQLKSTLTQVKGVI